MAASRRAGDHFSVNSRDSERIAVPSLPKVSRKSSLPTWDIVLSSAAISAGAKARLLRAWSRAGGAFGTTWTKRTSATAL